MAQYQLIHFNLNGKAVEKMVDVRASLTDLLRNDFHMTSVKKGCEVGECGACNVIIDGECFNSCIYLAVWAEGKHIRTLESLLGPNGELSDIQQAFIDETAVQCGFCTPGFIMTAVEILESGKLYTDGGGFNNVPLDVLVDRGYQDVIVVRIYGPGYDREKKVKIPEDTNIYTVAPKVSLGSIIEFDSRKTRTHLKLGYYDTLRMIYGLKGKIYYIDESEEECYYLNQLVKLNAENYRHIMTAYKLSQAESRYCRNMTEVVLPVMAEELKLSKDWTYKELYLAVLEATAKLCRISKYKVYTVDELREKIQEKLHGLSGRELPAFVWIVAKEIPEEISSTDE